MCFSLLVIERVLFVGLLWSMPMRCVAVCGNLGGARGVDSTRMDAMEYHTFLQGDIATQVGGQKGAWIL